MKVRRQCKCGAKNNLVPENGTIKFNGKKTVATISFICRPCLFSI